MTPERWQQVKTALDSVLDASPTQRPAMLDDVCSGDVELRSEVESLLAFENTDDGSFTKSNFSSVIHEVFTDEANVFNGRQIGKYKILHEIGVGGMGTVFLAERTDGEFDQKVAIKFLRQSFASKSARQRFLQERQILARLHHRFIAQLIDGGTTEDGTPYLVMEYVEGTPINEYVVKNDLPIRAKLDLFRNVCEAVSFAHRNLIVHRDLKPDNILITADGIPKLLDFGIAKLLSNNEIKATVTRQQALTPEYAAPEQLAGRDITTVSDIYSLGIILYEILTGTHPFRKRKMTAEKIWQAVIFDEPLRPSTAVTHKRENTNIHTTAAEINLQKTTRKILKGDLDTIILKALRKEPERRYDSVERFSQDIKSYLKGFPISARPDTFRYRAGKFLSRNPLASAAVIVAFVSLVCGIFVAVIQAQRANAERLRAERRFNDVRTLANSFMFEVNDKISESPIKARELLVSRAVEYLDNLAEESGNDPELESELATSYEKIGDVQSELFKPSLGKTSDALISHQKSLQIRQKLFDAAPQSVERGLAVVKSLQNIGGIFSMSGRVSEARETYLQGNEICRRLLAVQPNDFEVRRFLARGYARIGQAILRSGSLNETLDNYENSLKIFQDLSAEKPDDKSLKNSVAIVYSFIAYVKMQMNALDEAVKDFGISLKIQQQIAEENSVSKGGISSALLWYGISLVEAGKTEQGISSIRQSLALQTEIFEADQNNFGEQNALGDCYTELGKALLKNGEVAAAIENVEKGGKNYKIVWQNDPSNLSARRQIAYAQKLLGSVYAQKGELKKALENYNSALVTMRELTSADPNNTEWQNDLAICYKNLGEFFLKSGDSAQASANFQTALPILEKVVSNSPENVFNRRELESLKNEIAKVR